jgi:hypothetical protein
VLGERVELMPHVVLYHDVQLGDRTVIHAGTVLGAAPPATGAGPTSPCLRSHRTRALGGPAGVAAATTRRGVTLTRGAVPIRLRRSPSYGMRAWPRKPSGRSPRRRAARRPTA